MRRKTTLALMILFSGFLFQNCSIIRPAVKPEYGKEDKCGCRVPPADVFVSTGVNLKTAQSTINKLVVGGVDYNVTPDVIKIASQAMIDERIRAYIRCSEIRRNGFTPEQVSYFEDIARFLTTQPTPSPQDYIRYKEKFTFPPSPQEKPKTCEASTDWKGIVWSSVVLAGSLVAYFEFTASIKDDPNHYNDGAYSKARTVEDAKSERDKIEKSVLLYNGLRILSATTAAFSSYRLVKSATEKDLSY